ncbi:MAG TPA: 3-oxoadipate enol-lactonase [Acidimicrobiia bacterium]|nr:3-oxoadipate enol-lactonase [Acidimicrobiia bacterium]
MKLTSTADGTRLAWVEGGRGPALVLLHSLGTASAMWSAQATALEDRYRVLRVDLRGHGESDAPPGPYAIEMLGRDLLEVAQAAGLDRFHLGGISLGGQIAQWVAIHHAEHLKSVILSNTAARIGSEQGWTDRIAAVRQRGLSGISGMVVSGWFSEGFTDDEARSRATAMFEQTDPEGYIGCCHALATADLRDAVEEISMPTLIIAGEVDRSTPLSDAEWLHQRIPGSRLEVLEGRAHLPNLEEPEEYSGLLTDWLSHASSL